MATRLSPKQADKLRRAIPDGTLQILHGIGHMIHHVATQEVVDAIEEVARKSAANVLPRSKTLVRAQTRELTPGVLGWGLDDANIKARIFAQAASTAFSALAFRL